MSDLRAAWDAAAEPVKRISPEMFARLRAAVQQVESGGNPNAVSPKGATGLMQTMPGTLRDPGYGVTRARDTSQGEMLRVGNDYLRAMVDKHATIPEALAAYNWGPGNLEKKGMANAPAETRAYIPKVMALAGQAQPAAQPTAARPLQADWDAAESVKVGNADWDNAVPVKAVTPTPAAPAKPQTMREQLLTGGLDMIAPGGIGKTLMHGLESGANRVGEFVNDQAARVLPAPVAAGLGTAANVGVQTVPMMFGGAAGKVAQPAFERGGEIMMQKALRPTWESLRSGKAQRAGREMLEDGYNPTRGGVDAMKTRVADLKGQEAAITGPSVRAGSQDPMLDALRGVDRNIGEGTMRTEGLNAVDRVRQEFLTHPQVAMSAEYGSGIPVNVMQSMKERNYRMLGDASYGNGTRLPAEGDALKALTAALRTSIERAEPSVAPINAELSRVLNASKVAERRVMMGGNNNPIPLGTSIAAAVNNPAAALGLWANSSDYAKSMIARALYSGQIPANVGRAAGGAYGAHIGQGQQ